MALQCVLSDLGDYTRRARESQVCTPVKCAIKKRACSVTRRAGRRTGAPARPTAQRHAGNAGGTVGGMGRFRASSRGLWDGASWVGATCLVQALLIGGLNGALYAVLVRRRWNGFVRGLRCAFAEAQGKLRTGLIGRGKRNWGTGAGARRGGRGAGARRGGAARGRGAGGAARGRGAGARRGGAARGRGAGARRGGAARGRGAGARRGARRGGAARGRKLPPPICEGNFRPLCALTAQRARPRYRVRRAPFGRHPTPRAGWDACLCRGWDAAMRLHRPSAGLKALA